MNTRNSIAPTDRDAEETFEGGLAEFLFRLERLYRYLGLRPVDARAASLADAEIFTPPDAEPVSAT